LRPSKHYCLVISARIRLDSAEQVRRSLTAYDTATRSGLSGSPVIMKRHGMHCLVSGALTGEEIIGTISNFIGVYSGRMGKDEFKAQLGIVWRASVINDIVSRKHSEETLSE